MTPQEWERLKELLARLILLDTDGQEAVLQRELADHTDLRAAARELLDGFQLSTLNFPMSALAASSGGSALTVAADVTPPFAIEKGDMCGRYEVVRLLGRGGMGRVYLATDTELVAPVALKVPSERLLGSSEARIRLRGEAHNVARLRGHPCIATLIDLVHVDLKGRQFPVLVMEYVAGRSCADHLVEHPVSVSRTLRWARQIADALEYAHDRGVLHCDLKPQNVQVTEDDTIKVLDFGIARALYGPTAADTIVGTIPYMAPEQLRERRYTEAGDIYSLGVSIFELITGRRPFAGRDLETQRLEILGKPAPALSSLVPEVPVRLDVLVGRMLAKQPPERPHSMSEVRRELDALLFALDPPPPSLWERMVPRLRTAGTLLALLTFVGFVTSFAFDQALGRTGRFDDESFVWWPVWGVRMLFAPVVVCAFFSLPVVLVTMLVRRFAAPGWARKLSALVAAPSANQLALLVLTASVLGVNLFVWGFAPAISAISSIATNEPAASLGWLREDNSDGHNLYRYLSFFLWVLSAWGWIVVGRRRKRRLETTTVALSILGALVLCVALALWALPYRLLFQSKMEKVHMDSEACYVAGRESSDLLLFCPRAAPPRTRVVKANDPRLRPDSKIEKIFFELNTAPSQ
jgi:hypothetical protein